MTDDVFKQTRKKITPQELESENPLDQIRAMQEAVAKETGKELAKPFSQEGAPFQVSGAIPPQFQEAVMKRQQSKQMGGQPELPPIIVEQQRKAAAAKAASPLMEEDDDVPFEPFEAPPERANKPTPKRAVPDSKVRLQGSDQLETLLQTLANKHHWEEFELLSKGKFYTNIPPVLHIRAMTGEEEQILSTQRWVKKGKAIDMIFANCIREKINTEDLLSSDRTHLLIFLRGISHTPEYDVEIKCPACGIKFAHVINLDQLDVTECPENFGTENLSGTLPSSGFSYTYRIATGQDEQEIAQYRERRIQQWGDQGEDDTLLYRTALLLEEIQGVSMKKELALLLKRLPIQDVSHLRNEINTPPFGVDTELPILCPNCDNDFKIDLPLEANFFFPKKNKEKARA